VRIDIGLQMKPIPAISCGVILHEDEGYSCVTRFGKVDEEQPFNFRSNPPCVTLAPVPQQNQAGSRSAATLLWQSEGRFTKATGCRNGASLGPAYNLVSENGL